MKLSFFRLSVLIIIGFQFVNCKDFVSSRYTLMLPQVQEARFSLLGEPHWRVEWLNYEGKRQIADILPGKSLAIEIPSTWTNPVTAWPFWPEHNLLPGLFYPAGALFPFDVNEASGNCLVLTWEGGVDAVFYRSLALSDKQDGSKMPAYFDWVRFRELFSAESLSEEVLKDPWLVDWQSVADLTLSSNFDRRRLVPQKTEILFIPVSAGPWYGMSVFAEPLFISEEDSGVPVVPGVNVWISEEGILRVNGKTWVFNQWRR